MKWKIRSGNASSMKPVNDRISACRHCRSYRAEGRRGGYCQQLGVPVQGSWKTCSLAMAPFTANWQQLAGIGSWLSPSSDPETQITSELALPTLTLPETEAIPVVPVTPIITEEMLMGLE
ncbi:MAG: hypothetical protein EDM05_029480 [Leptolyngbya sp. IPPAS B-1204]|nr:hypothetical protein [Elainella sp. C42_A2020_010]